MIETRTIEPGGRKWWIRPALAAPILADGWPPDSPERLEPVKRGSGRAISRFRSGGRGFFVKVYAGGGPLGRLRALLGLGRARREWDALLAARRAGLDVPEPVALARSGPEVLVTAEVEGGRRLDEYLFERYFEPLPGDPPYPGARPPELVAVYRRRVRPAEAVSPRDLAHRLAALVAQLAEADLYLPDLHPGNILIAGDPRGWRLYLVDLAEAIRPAPDEAVLQHLMQLEHFFEPIATAAERIRCLGRLGDLLGRPLDARAVWRATEVYRRRFYRHRDQRTRRESKYFARLAAGRWRGWAAADWAEAVAEFLAASPSGLPDCQPSGMPEAGGAAVLKEGRTSSVWRVTLPDGRPAVLKRHNRAGQRALRNVGRPSRSLAAFRKGHAMLVRGVATARPAAAADFRGGPGRRQTVLLTEPVEGRTLPDWLRGGPPPGERRRVTWRLARAIRRLHDAGFSHRDLKAPNVLVTPPPGSRPVLVDLDGLREAWYVSNGRRARDLMRLSVSLDEWGVARRTDRLRFLRAYLGRRGSPSPITIRARRSLDAEALFRPPGSRRVDGPAGAAEAQRGEASEPRPRPPESLATLTATNVRRWWGRIARLSARKMEALRRKGP
jgi:tRNA A-37 threonylcarbamoyl transferase component Bud32